MVDLFLWEGTRSSVTRVDSSGLSTQPWGLLCPQSMCPMSCYQIVVSVKTRVMEEKEFRTCPASQNCVPLPVDLVPCCIDLLCVCEQVPVSHCG